MKSNTPRRGNRAVLVAVFLSLRLFDANLSAGVIRSQSSRVSCAEVLGRIPSSEAPTSKAVLPAGVVDLTGQPWESVRSRAGILGGSSVLLLDHTILQDRVALNELQQSKVTFAVRANGSSPDDSIRYLQRSISRVETVVSLPSDIDGVVAMFGMNRAVAGPALAHLNAVRAELRSIPGVQVLTGVAGLTMAETIKRKASSSSADILNVVGHNVGGILYFADGSAMGVDAIHSVAKAAGRKVMVISCDTVTVASTVAQPEAVTLRPLDYHAIAAALRSGQDRVARGGATMVDYLRAMDRLGEDSSGSSVQMVGIILVIAGGVVIAVMASKYFWQCDGNDGNCAKESK